MDDIRPDIEVLRQPITEPYKWYKTLTGRKESVNVGFIRTGEDKPEGRLEKASRWIRGNLFIPDARKFWIRPSVRYLLGYLHDHQIDAIITTGPPHSMHLIGMQLAEKTGLPWMADFRDPWTGIDYYDDLLLTKRADKRHHQLERKVLSSASVVTTVSAQIKKELISKGAHKVEVVPNGFDPSDFEDIPSNAPDADSFTLVHMGSLVPSRNPDALWEALSELCAKNPEFGKKLKIRLVGSTDSSVLSSIRHFGLESNTEIISYLPHAEAIKHVFSASVLLLLINNTANAEGFLSGKVFEYLASGKPILCVGPEKGDAAQLLEETGAGRTAGFGDKETIRNILLHWFEAYRLGKPAIRPNEAIISGYSRKTQAGTVARLLDELI